ncbi:MAG: TonB-dependent receptor [Verrucomicrobia bacterium]|nr:TonB-dependent receptor [Verrucomicrobiota bacterium]
MKTHLLLKIGLVVSLLPHFPPSLAQAPPSADSVVIEAENKVEKLPSGTTTWMAAKTNEVLKVKDRFRTGFKSRATLRLSNQGILRVSQLTTLEIQPPADATKEQSVLDLKSGTAYFFNRDKPIETQFQTPQASGAIRGTEFNLEVEESGRTVVTMLDGAVDLTNQLGQVSLASGEQGIVDPGQAPRKTAVIDAINIIQWGLYYPGVLDVSELLLSDAEKQALNESLTAYRAGDLLQALASYPTNRVASSSQEIIYSAALQLSVGQVKEADALLGKLGASDSDLVPYADAVRQLIAAVKFQTWNRASPPKTATEWMAESYYQQSRSKLEEARTAARSAADKSPKFGFAWVRLAEMEFSFGRTATALDAVEKSLSLSPRNAQALALKGFLLAAQNRIQDALSLFDQAIAIDGGLGNAWLGRGLCKIRRGNRAAGREDLQVAATLEPHRGVLRSYLSKAYSNEGDLTRAREEIELAKRYDPNDPTAFLYSALLAQEKNQINDGIRDLERSKELNDNRSVFRSRLLLDQDRAVRSANLAAIYRDNGMFDLSVREASRAANYDYGNFSAHLFLANSYNELRDPNQITLRYETPWLAEFLLANLLAPVGAGTLSQNISQQEYSKLFERDRFGLSSSTEYLSRGAWLQTASQFATFGNSSYSFDVNYRSDTGERQNQDLEAMTWWASFKQQLTPKDTLFVQGVYYDFQAGDLAQYYNNYGPYGVGTLAPSLTRRIKENQEPLVFAGYHHEWGPGNHTLFLAGRLHDDFRLTQSDQAFRVLTKPAGPVTAVQDRVAGIDFRSELEGLTSELQQIWQQPKQTIVIGGRFQAGWQDTLSILAGAPTGFPSTFDVDTELLRAGIYGYHQWQILDPLRLTVGLSYDYMDYPANIDVTPVVAQQLNKDRVSPKAGLLWTPARDTHVRGFYSQSLGGLFFDTSVRLEPVQIAGFTQGYRSLIPESLGGLVAGSEFDLWGAALDHKFPTGTYVGVEGLVSNSEATRPFGVYDVVGPFFNPTRVASTTPQDIEYRERAVLVTLNQLLGREWSLGIDYKISEADLESRFPGIPENVPYTFPAAGATGTAGVLNADQSAVLHQVNLSAFYALRCGFFSQFQAQWYGQNNRQQASNLVDENFWHLNFFVGYRFPRRLAELRVGLLNLTDQDYQLNPLNLYRELPRERTFAARFRFNF